MANAELEDRNYVTKDDIVNVFRISFKRWDNMAETVKLSTAYHEAGHYVIGRIVNSGVYEILAVSIYPTDDYNGINVFEYNDEVTPVTNRSFYLNSMALDLGGRAAEELVFNDINSGASEDLCNTTETAKTMIMEYGLGGKVSKNRYYFDFDMGVGSGEDADEISDEVDKVIEEAYKLSKKYLTENRDYLDAIAKALVSNQILMREELDQIWAKVTEARKRKEARSHGHSYQKKLKNTEKRSIVKSDIRTHIKKGKRVAKRIRKEMAKMFK